MNGRTKRPRAILTLCAALGFSVAAAPDRPDEALEGATLIDARPLRGPLFHVQGLALDGSRVWVTSVDRRGRRGYLSEFDRATGRPLRRTEVTQGALYHAGGISLAGRSLWIPVAEMRPHSSAVLLELDADSLRVRRRIPVADHIGCVAARGGMLVAGNWDSGRLYIFDLSGRAPVRVVVNPSPTHFQDMKFDGDMLVAAGDRSWWSGQVDWLHWPSLNVARSLRAGAVWPIRPLGRGGPYTGEGFAIEGRELFVLPEDGPSRLFRFRLNA